MKKLLSTFLCICLWATLILTAFAATNSLSNFSKEKTYQAGMFTDVPENEWYASSVAEAYEYGLMNGVSNNSFNPNGNVTLAETITVAARIHSIFADDGESFESVGKHWYDPYVEYALKNGMIPFYIDNYERSATRAEYASILYTALPDSALLAKSSIENDSIPDVSLDTSYGPAVYRLYRAGVLTGNDKKGTFTPDANIQRMEVAAIVTRMANPANRKAITLKTVGIPLYAADGRVIEVASSDLDKYIAVGWSKTPISLNITETGTWGDNYFGNGEYEYGNGYLYVGGTGSLVNSPSWANNKTNIHTVYVKRGITTLYSSAFEHFSNLSRVEIPDTVTSIQHSAFYDCALTRIGIPASVTDINTGLFGTYYNYSYFMNITIYCEAGSAAESYAKTYKMPFVISSIVYSPDGRTCMVSESELLDYLANGWYEYPVTKMYAPDGRTIIISIDEIESYKSTGWYENISDVYNITLYALDGRTCKVSELELPDYIANGWYESPVTKMYAPDGRTTVIPTSEIDLYKSVGWYENINDIYVTMYALDGRTQSVLIANIPIEQSVGWYLYGDYICALADEYLKNEGYNSSTVFLENILRKMNPSDFDYEKFSQKLESIYSSWSKYIGCPMAILGSSISFNSIGTPEANITFRNLTNKTIDYCEVKFTCYDAHNKITTDYPSLYNGTFKGYSNDNIAPYGIVTWTWTLYSNEKTFSIGNLYMLFIRYTDNTTWSR